MITDLCLHLFPSLSPSPPIASSTSIDMYHQTVHQYDYRSYLSFCFNGLLENRSLDSHHTALRNGRLRIEMNKSAGNTRQFSQRSTRCVTGVPGPRGFLRRSWQTHPLTGNISSVSRAHAVNVSSIIFLTKGHSNHSSGFVGRRDQTVLTCTLVRCGASQK